MRAIEFLNLLLLHLKKVLACTEKYTELQAIVDRTIVNDELPEDLTNTALRCIFDLQTDLELIAEHQCAHAGTTMMLTEDEILEKLRKYQKILEKQ